MTNTKRCLSKSALVAALALAVLATPTAAEQPIDVISHLDTAKILPSLSLEQQQFESDRLALESVLRIAYVIFDPTELYERAEKEVTEALVRFDLFPDVTVEYRLELRKTVQGRGNLWSFHETQRSSALIRCPSAKLDRITWEGGREHQIEHCHMRVWPDYTGPHYTLRKIRGESHVWALEEKLARPVIDAIPPPRTPPADRNIVIPSDPPRVPSGSSTFEFVVLFTDAVVEAGWAPNGIEGQIDIEIGALNQAFQDSSLPYSATLKAVVPYPFGECCVGVEDLPEVWALRLGWGADVGILVGTSVEIAEWAQQPAGAVCAAANQHSYFNFSIFPEYAIIGYTPELPSNGEGCGTLTLAHELGHAVGGCHQEGSPSNIYCTPHDGSSYAFANIGDPNYSTDYVTVLGAFDGGCELCEVQPVYSEEGGVFGGDQRPIGSPSADMVGVFNANGGLVADLVDGEHSNTVEVERQGDGAEGGWIESVSEADIPDGRIACGERCADSYRLGTEVTLRVDVGITQANGAEFVRWLDDCETATPPDPGEVPYTTVTVVRQYPATMLCGGRRGRDRYPGPAASRSPCSQAVLPQALEGAGCRAATARDRQAQELRRGASRADAFGSPRHDALRQQSS
jgi:hypothetical protein